MKYRFSSSDKEWHQTFVNAFENILRLKIKPVLVYDRRQFSKYVYKDNIKPNSVWAECIKECGIIWLNPRLANAPKVETANTLYHECLHIKYPQLSETEIKKLADKTIPINIEKVKIFDITHKK